MEISKEHKKTKGGAYWDDLVKGITGEYKERKIDELILKYLKVDCNRILDVGVGTSSLGLKYKDILGATAVCIDYDEKVISQMKDKYSHLPIEWYVQDIFKIKGWEQRFELVFFLDMLHEVYSFYGRPNMDINQEVDHERGQKYVFDALNNITQIVNPGGGVIITDNVLCEEDKTIEVRAKSKKVIETIKYFAENYKTKQINIVFVADDIFEINSRDFCILLTQYNKIKNQDWERWNTEKFEIHQYYTEKEYIEEFSKIGFNVHTIVGTPNDTREEYELDFEVINGLDSIPEKRITLLAIKK
jgi:SAM-dependent methyltransferase